MTKSQAHEALSALLTSIAERPYCRTLACPGCELPHLRPELEKLRDRSGAELLDAATLDILRASVDQSDDRAPALRRGLAGASVLAPDLLPRPALAFLKMREIILRIRQSRRGSSNLLLHLLRIIPCWPEVGERVARGEIATGHIFKALVNHLQAESAGVLPKKEQEVVRA
jgi:hypothetical protein